MKLVFTCLIVLLCVSCSLVTLGEPPPTETPAATSTPTATETPTIPSWQAANTAVVATLSARPVLPTVAVTPVVTFKYDDTTSQDQRVLIQQALALGQRYYGNVDRVNIYTSPTNIGLCKEYMALASRTTCPNVEGFIAYAIPDGGIFVLTSSDGWRQVPNGLKMHTVIHEYVHLVQFYLAYPIPPHYGVDAGPLWLYEGSADLLAARVLESEHLDDFNSFAFGALVGTRRINAPLRQLETRDGAKLAGSASEYVLGFKALEYLEKNHGGSKAILKFFDRLNTGSGWRGAFNTAFGISAEEFYDRFEEYRRDNFPPL